MFVKNNFYSEIFLIIIQIIPKNTPLFIKLSFFIKNECKNWETCKCINNNFHSFKKLSKTSQLTPL
jgi:hypothetical protein